MPSALTGSWLGWARQCIMSFPSPFRRNTWRAWNPSELRHLLVPRRQSLAIRVAKTTSAQTSESEICSSLSARQASARAWQTKRCRGGRKPRRAVEPSRAPAPRPRCATAGIRLPTLPFSSKRRFYTAMAGRIALGGFRAKDPLVPQRHCQQCRHRAIAISLAA
jgi:hypothetical protein